MKKSLSAEPFRESRLNTESDFRPEWDVAGLNRGLTEQLTRQIRDVRGRSEPDPGQKIQVLLAPPGYGKTHLFGRIAHEMGAEMFVVFIPAFEDVTRPLEHLRWHVVENLFRERQSGPALLHQALATRCLPSFRAYVAAFPPSQAARYESLRQSLQQGSETVLGMIQAVKLVAPFQQLAASVAKETPHVSTDVMRVLALGWSPVTALARRWLRGESLSEEELICLGLAANAEPPNPLEVLKGIAALLGYQIPIVLCCDQIEMVLKHPHGPEQVTAELIEVLHRVPGQVLILSCLDTEWDAFKKRSFLAFQQRTAKPLTLEPLTDTRARELVACRLRTWQGHDSQKNLLWPFDEASLLTYLRKTTPGPRSLIQRCEERFTAWLEEDSQGVIYLATHDREGDPLKAFLEAWNAELEKINNDPRTAWSEYQEERLYRGVQEVLLLARDAGRDMAGVRVRNVAANALRQRGAAPRRALTVDLTAAGKPCRLVVPVTTLNHGQQFRFYFEDIEQALESGLDGCLLVHRQTEFTRGGKTAERFEALLGKRLRIFALEENAATLQRLECLLRFLDRAEGKELQIANLTLSYKDCQDFVLKTSVLDSLDLLKALGAWSAGTAVGKPLPQMARNVAGTMESMKVVAVAPTAITAVVGLEEVVRVRKEEAQTTLVAPADMTAPQEPWAQQKLEALTTKLKLWGLPVMPAGIELGPSFARLNIAPSGSKTTFNKVRDRATDLKIHLGLNQPPLINSQPNCISVDVELPQRRTVPLTGITSSFPAGLAGQPVFPVGVDVAGQTHWLNLADTADCHLLVAGQTGSGKSEFLRVLVAGLAARLDPAQLQFVLIDPKRVTFNLGELESPYLHGPIVHGVEESLPILEWCTAETQRRYDLLAQEKITNVEQLADQTVLPRIVVVVDEFADLMIEKATKALLNPLLKRIGAMSRAAGIHLVLATQRPDKDVVTPQLKNNLPGRIALRVANEANSRLILNDPSAACLLGKGDLLWQRGGGLLRLQSPFVTQADLEKALRAH